MTLTNLLLVHLSIMFLSTAVLVHANIADNIFFFHVVTHYKKQQAPLRAITFYTQCLVSNKPSHPWICYLNRPFWITSPVPEAIRPPSIQTLLDF